MEISTIRAAHPQNLAPREMAPKKWTLEVCESIRQSYPALRTAGDGPLQIFFTSQQSVAAS